MTTFDFACRYAGLGWQIFPCHRMVDGRCSCHRDCNSPGKHPAGKWKEMATNDRERVEAFGTSWNARNIGLATGKPSALFVLDVDSKSDGPASLQAIEKGYGALPKTVTARTGGGGFHYFFRMPPGTDIRNSAGKIGPGLDIRGTGGYVVLPPSNHASGDQYVWLEGTGPGEIDLAEAPKWLIEAACQGKRKGVIKTGNRNEELFRRGCILRARGLEEEEIYERLWAMNLEKCEVPLEEAEVQVISSSCATYEAGVEGFIYDRDMVNIIPNNPDNIRFAIQRLGVKLAFNEFAGRREMNDRPLRDVDVSVLRYRIYDEFHFIPPKMELWEAIYEIAERNSYHPVRDYLDSLKWDGVQRVDEFLTRYAGAEDTELNRAFSRAFLVSLVRRIRKPGCKFDPVLVLEGRQGIGKSTLFRTLCPDPKWFTDCAVLFKDEKELIETTRGTWIVEEAELIASRRTWTDVVKSAITRQEDKARPAYGRETEPVPRQFVIVGTTNEKTYLQDSTGGRRYWPVACGQIDIEGLARDRDQILAEASELEEGGEPGNIPERLYGSASQIQEARFDKDTIEEVITEAIGEKEGYILKSKLEDHLQIHNIRLTNRNRKKIKRIMTTRLGWEEERKRVGEDGARKWCWTKGPREEEITFPEAF